jgi:hypothetical protein
MKRPRKRLRMFSLLLASINIHYNVSLSERHPRDLQARE